MFYLTGLLFALNCFTYFFSVSAVSNLAFSISLHNIVALHSLKLVCNRVAWFYDSL